MVVGYGSKTDRQWQIKLKLIIEVGRSSLKFYNSCVRSSRLNCLCMSHRQKMIFSFKARPMQKLILGIAIIFLGLKSTAAVIVNFPLAINTVSLCLIPLHLLFVRASNFIKIIVATLFAFSYAMIVNFIIFILRGFVFGSSSGLECKLFAFSHILFKKICLCVVIRVNSRRPATLASTSGK